MRLYSAFCAAGFLAAQATAAQYAFDLNPDRTRIGWTLSDPLHTVHGTFRLKSGTLRFDNESGAISGRIVVDAASGYSGSDARDKRMHANVLESKKYTDAVFSPNRIEGRLNIPGDSTVKIHGSFEIHGAAHELTMNAQIKAAADRASATLQFDVPYVAWEMKDPSTFLLKVGKSVPVTVETTGSLTAK